MIERNARFCPRPRFLTVLASVILIAGCSSSPHRSTYASATNRPAGVSVSAGVDWQWSVSGDTAIRPAQVFSVDAKTFVQMRAGQAIPAVFVNNTPVPFDVAPPYIVISGVPTTIDLMVRNYRAVLVHTGPAYVSSGGATELDPGRLTRTDAANAAILPESGPTPLPMPVARMNRNPVAVEVARNSATDTGVVWAITKDDGMLSAALERWAGKAGYPLRWESAVDLPVIRTSEYHTDSFYTALAALLSDADSASYDFRYSLDAGTVVITSTSR